MTKAADEIAALRARVEELERANKPPEKFVPDNWQPPNPIDRVSMSPQTMRDLALPDHLIRGIVRDNRAPQGPSSAGAIPSSQQVTNVCGAGGGSGWAHEIPLGPPPGVHLVDALCIADDVKSRSKGKS
jgi:hypothetical protein